MSVGDYSFEKPHLRNPNLHAIERICLLDLFGMEQEQQLGEASTWLRAAAVTRLQQSSAEGARPSTPMPTRNACPLSLPDAVLENQPAAKRQATSQQVGRNCSQDIEMEQVVDTPFSQPIQPVQLSGSDPYSTMSPGFDYQLPQTNSQVQQALPPDNVLLSADLQWDFGLADLFTEDYVNNPVEDANLVNPHPFPLPNASVQQYFEASQPISDVQFSTICSPSVNSAESSHANSSTDVDSHRHTIFTNVVSSGHSHEHTASNMEDMPHAACSTPTSADQVDQVIKHYLEKNPTHISTEDRMQKLEAWVGTRERRAHWERGEIIDYFFGPDLPVPFNSSLPMSCAKAPKRLDKSSSKEWIRMSAGYFPGFPLPGPGIRPLRALPAPAPAPAREHARIPRILANSRPLGSIPGHCGHLYHKCHHIHMWHSSLNAHKSGGTEHVFHIL
ncbi:hypothetical protein BDV93DRAFT_565662 [Ceratobasidium sp. AG-I]|nr:hypothetical protein BDV93DRAFT_565662 [Ceratobasidium sp. AG-I]